MARRNDCYVDTSAFIAFLAESDKYHQLFSRLFADPPPMVTSALTIAEGHSWFLRKYDAQRAAGFLGFVRELEDLTIESFDDRAIADVTAIAAKFQDQKLTLVDAHGLAIMKEYALKSCWSTDRHLGLTGVPLATREIF
jgi:predicted nucleic acid-binding protein